MVRASIKMNLATLVVAISLFITAVVVADIQELRRAEPCHEGACKLPQCRCSSTNIPGGLSARDTPQFVLITFDDAVNVINIETYRAALYNRKNRNGCPAGVTFFINHEYTNYQLVNELYNQGFEISLHSITHRTPQTFWARANFEDMMREFGDQRIQMAHFANIPYESIPGLRMPFLQLAGNASFQMMKEVGLTYDLSWPTISSLNPGLWPYTLHYASTQDCHIPPCPTASIPGPWVLPMISWLDLSNRACSMVDGCFSRPGLQDEEGWYQFFVTNFERHYLGNRAPFGFYVHEWFIGRNPAIKAAFIRFLNLLNNLKDVYMVNAREVIDWVKDPIPVDEYEKKPCRRHVPASCQRRSCGPLRAPHTSMQYWMQVCSMCPRYYPWIGNPLGQ